MFFFVSQEIITTIEKKEKKMGAQWSLYSSSSAKDTQTKILSTVDVVEEYITKMKTLREENNRLRAKIEAMDKKHKTVVHMLQNPNFKQTCLQSIMFRQSSDSSTKEIWSSVFDAICGMLSRNINNA